MNRALQLGTWLAGLHPDDIPSASADKAAEHYLDTLGAIVAGAGQPVARIARDTFTAPGPCRLFLGPTAQRDAVDAARINAAAAHALEIDDTEGLDHSGAVVVPAILALDDQLGGIGMRQQHTALVAGYEIGRRVQSSLGGYAAHNAAGWHSTATCGVFAAAAAAGVILGLDAQRMASALGIAASLSAGGWAFSASGAMTKQLHPAFASGNGMLAARLAAAGATGPPQIFDDDVWGGFYATHGAVGADPAQLTEGIGERWAFNHSAIKPYATCRSAHSAIDALREALDSGKLSPQSIRKITIRLDPYLLPMIGQFATEPPSQARMSLPVALALALNGSALLPGDYSPQRLTECGKWLRHMHVVADHSLAGGEPWLRVETSHGPMDLHHPFASGGAHAPLGRAQVVAKFRALTNGLLPAQKQDSLIGAALG